ncbi:MAG: SDR family NAD(P)-dependent oxidoreductase [Chloroflexota bacterium]
MTTDRATSGELSPLKRAFLALEEMQARLDAMQRARREPIAIVGLGCRFPGGAHDPEIFWQLLRDGVDAIREVPADRWDIDAYFDPDADAPGKMNTRWGGFLDGVDQFDPQFFGIAPREAASMDPQQRLLLEVAWEALERAGQAPARLVGSRTGVFVGISGNDYARLHLEAGGLAGLDAYHVSGVAHSIAAGRLSYVLGLQGPSMSVDTACSSSLVAVHLACQSLRQGESDLALAGGVNLILHPENTVTLSRLRMMAPGGRCRTFDVAGDGYVRGEGCGIVVLKRLSDAVANGDSILAVIRGSAVNQDGPSGGLTAPNGPAQEAVIRDALVNAGIGPGDVSYVETHGTGTSLGDPIEVGALAAALGQQRAPDDPLMIGSVKTNIGHLEPVAGVASLIKTVLALQHGEIPPHLHLENPNPYIPWDQIPVVVPTERTPWRPKAGRRFAGVSSFGFSGTNAHVVVEEAPAAIPTASAHGRPLHLLSLSARSESALAVLAQRYADQLTASPTGDLADICYTANTGRSHFTHRVAIIAADCDQLRDRLTTVRAGQRGPGIARGTVQEVDEPKLAFLFTGQGSQYAGMGRMLDETQPTFRAAVDECEAILGPYLDRPLRSLLYSTDATDNPLDQTRYTQAALFALEYALVQLWKSWGIEPGAVLGHSVGEYVAACVAGVFSLGDGLRLIAERGRLMQSLPTGGEMFAVQADETVVAGLIAPVLSQVSIAAVNGPSQTVISGASEALQSVVSRLQAEGIKTRRLAVSHAFHSPLMDPILDDFERAARRVAFAPPRIRLISNLTGRAEHGDLTKPEYWRRHVRATVRFADGVATLREHGYTHFVEVGPNPALLAAVQDCISPGEVVSVPSLRHGRGDWDQLLASLGELYVQGVNPNWSDFDRDVPRRRVALPTYPFERQRHWISGRSHSPVASTPSASPESAADGTHPFLGSRLRSALKTTQFESELSTSTLPLLDAHRAFGTSIMPAMVFLEMALAGGRAATDWPKLTVEDLAIREALVVPDGEVRACQTVIRPEQEDTASFEIFSFESDGERWVSHVSGKIRKDVSDLIDAPIMSIDEIQARCPEQTTAEAHYTVLREHGLDFGPSLRGVQHVWRRDGEALGRIRLPKDAVSATAPFACHPAMLDAAAQLVAEAHPDANTFLPMALESFRLCAPVGDEVWGHVVVRSDEGASPDSLVADVRLLGDNGQVLAELRGLSHLRARSDTLFRLAHSRFDRWVYEVHWRPDARSGATSLTPNRAGSWLILADSGGVGEELARVLAQRGHACQLAVPDASFGPAGPGRWMVDPAKPDHLTRLLRELQAASTPPTGVIHLWSLDIPSTDRTKARELAEAQVRSCGAAISLVQALVGGNEAPPPQLWLVTRGAQHVTSAGPLAVGQAPLEGLANVIRLEHPELSCVYVDLDPDDSVTSAEALIPELELPDGEDRVAIRDGVRHVARLIRCDAPRLNDEVRRSADRLPVRLATTDRGALDKLTMVPMSRRVPGPGEVEVQVRATGLNFKDVLNALGMLPGPTLPFGMESAGTVTAVGSSVTDLSVGDDVLVLGPESFSSFVTTTAQLVVRKPASLSLSEAATTPVAFLTAAYGLDHLAGLKAGERVLIHAATGGVGLAAVQLALRAGAEVFATAGSARKQAYLRSLGVQHVMSSRTLDFADQILTATNGEGVDVVLNSLSGDFIARGLAALSETGRFLELGKRGIWEPEQVAELRPRAQYLPYDLGDPMRQAPALLRSMLIDILGEFERGALEPLPLQVFPMSEVDEAFRFMAQARHIGKIAVVHPAVSGAQASGAQIQADGTYLITGGLGGLGLIVADWLVDQGARNLVLVGRRAAAAAAEAVVNRLEERGARVLVARADVSQADAVARLFAEIDGSMPPLRGIIHAAGILDDGVLLRQDWARFSRVLAPKLEGAWNLHIATIDRPLDFFVLFSSISALFGSPGQGSYAAANSFLDALAHHRRALGLAALSIDWGVWSEAGLAAERGTGERVAGQGIGMISPAEGQRVLGQLLTWDQPQVVVTPVDWSRYAGQQTGPRAPLFLSEVLAEAPTPVGDVEVARPKLQALIAEALPQKRWELIRNYVRQQAGLVLGLDAVDVDEHVPFSEIGLDSLMAVELRNLLGTALEPGQVLPATLAFDYPTVTAITNYLVDEVLGVATTDSEAVATPAARNVNGTTAPVVAGTTSATALKALVDLSDDEIDRLFSERLGARS